MDKELERIKNSLEYWINEANESKAKARTEEMKEYYEGKQEGLEFALYMITKGLEKKELYRTIERLEK